MVGNRKRRADGIVSRDFRGDGYFCATCLKPVEHEGDKLCDRCKANNARTIKIASAARNTTDHPWRQLSNGQYKLYMAKKKWKEEHGDREGV
jgi:predicted amidophosphoribosyltransferase